MDFLNRDGQQRVNSRVATPTPQSSPVASNDKKATDQDNAFFLQPKWMRGLFLGLLLSGTVLAVAVVCLMAFGGRRESNYVHKDNYQAVFLTNGQVYFAKVDSISNKYVSIQDIYYLSSQSQTTDSKDKTTDNSSMSLVKLGCELHGPTDQMIVNRDQVTFWENLNDSGKVAKAIAQWKKDNPKGLTCSETTSTPAQSTPATNASDLPATTTSDKKQ